MSKIISHSFVAFATVALVLAFVLLMAFPGSVGAFWWGWGDDDGNTTVNNNNSANVQNNVDVSANSGANHASTGGTGNGGDSGDLENENEAGSDHNDVVGSGSGDAGNGGDTNGSTILTGNAEAGALVYNDVNSNRTSVDRCGCEDLDGDDDDDDNDGDVEVRNRNDATVLNTLNVRANTGWNSATTYGAGNGGDSGEVENDNEWFSDHNDVVDSGTGDGGDGGNENGSFIDTGNASAGSAVVNIVNRNVTRVRS
jgi:hypothetical protein